MRVELAGTRADGRDYNATYDAAAAADGTWKVLLDAMPAAGDFVATATCAACAGGAGARAQLKNLTFGDVWVAAGQSNMVCGIRIDASTQSPHWL